MRLVAIVLSWNGREDTLACLESLSGVETVCVDNGSNDGSPEAIAERFPEVELVRAGVNLGFAAGNNVGIRRALARGADWVLLLNNDATADPRLPAALERAVAARPDAGVLGCKVYAAEPPDRLEYAGGRVNLWLGHHGRPDGFGRHDDGRFDVLRDVGRVTGAAMAVSRAAIESAGGLAEELFAYVEDVEWCLRIRRSGYAVVFVPEARAWHRGSASTGGAASLANLYYSTRNTIIVCERYRPLPRGFAGLRRGAIVSAHAVRCVRHPHRSRAVWAVVRGWRDARRGRSGPLPNPFP